MTTRDVLIVDDEPQNLEYHIRDLKENGFSVTEAADVKLALGFALSKKDVGAFDAIVLDMMMPTGNVVPAHEVRQGLSTGTFLLRHFRENGHECPVLILTNLSITDIMLFIRERFHSQLGAMTAADEREAIGHLWKTLLVRIEEKRRMPWFRLAPYLSDMIARKSPQELS